jgi:tetratricopeptide (TPR) repeat protein
MKDLLFLLILTLLYSCKTAEDHQSRGLSNLELGNYNEAIDDYTKAIKLKPDYPEAFYSRGNLKDNYGAIAEFIKVIEFKPNYANAYYYRGNSKAKLKDYNGAIGDYTNAIELKPDYLDAYLNRASSKKTLGNPFCSDYKKACELGDSQSCDWHNADCI